VFDLGWLHVGLSKTQLQVLLVLSSRADRDRGTCFPSRETIANEAGLNGDVKRVQRTARELELAGAITIEHRTGCTSLYWIRPAPDCEVIFQHWPTGDRIDPSLEGIN